MAYVDIDPFGRHDKPDAHPDEHLDETIPFMPGEVIEGGTWEPECKQEASFRGTSLRMKVLRECIEVLYRKLSEITGQTSEALLFDDFELKGGKLYHKCKSEPLMIRGRKLRSVGEIVKIWGRQDFVT